MQPLEIVAVACIGVGLVLTALGALRGMVAMNPITAYSAGQAAEASAIAASKSPKRVRWSRVLIVGIALSFAGMMMINFV